MLFFKDRCYIPPHKELRWEVVKQYHNSLPGGHSGHFKTLELIQYYYWWSGMTVFVKNYVTGCAICQWMKINTHLPPPGLIPIKGQKDAKPFSQVTCDFIMDLPKSNGFDSLMVVVDHGSTKGVISIPCNKTIDATLTHGTKLHWSGVPTLRTPWLLSIWLWPTIFPTSLQRNSPTPKNQNAQKHGISSSDRWRNRKSQPGTRNLFLSLLLQQPQNVETAQLPHEVQPQSKDPLNHKTHPVLPHDGVQTERYPLGVQ